MARLPSQRFLIQQAGADVVLFEEGTEREIVRYPAGIFEATARAQKIIHDCPGLDEQDKAFAHFWAGYFWAGAGMSDPETDLRDRAPNRGRLAGGG
jgi:hypothetical protein